MPRLTSRRAAGPLFLVSIAAVALPPVPAALAQTAYTAANGNTSILPWRYGFLSADFPEAKVGLTFNLPVILDRAVDPDRARRIAFSIFTSAAARKGQRDLFSGLDFNPGFDAGGGVGYVVPRERGYSLLFLRATYTTNQRDIIDIDGPTTTLDRMSTRSLGGAVGFNFAVSNTTVLGFALEGRRELSSPGVRMATEYCTPGNSAGGFRVLVCADRYLAPLRDLWSGQARADVNLGFASLGGAPNAARLGVATAAAIDFVEGASEEMSIAIGPSISLRDYPGQPVAILLVGFRDLFDVNGPEPATYFDGHFLVRLTLGIPFKVLAGQ